WHGYGNLADGPIVPHRAALSVALGRSRRILEPWRFVGCRGDSPRRQHGLSMARVSQLCGAHSFCRLHAGGLVGGANVPLSSRGTNLHYAVVLTRRVPVVPVAVRGWSVNALRRAGAGSVAIGCRLVVRK